MGKRNSKSIFILSQIILFVFCIVRFNYFNVDKVEDFKGEYVVVEKYSNYVILECDNVKYLYFDDTLERGNKVSLEGSINFIDDNSDFYNYLKSQKVNYVIEGEIISNNDYISFNDKIINYLLRHKDSDNRQILELVLFSKKNESSEDFYKYFEIFSITFMLVISGYHINLLLKILEKTGIVKYIIGLFYLYLLNFGVSSLKAFLYYVLKRIVRKTDLIVNNCDILSLIMIALLMCNPSYCFNKGFIYSFAFSFIIDFINNIIVDKGIKLRFTKKVLIYLFSIPIILMDSYQLNSNSFLVNVVMMYPISFLFVFSFVYLFLDKFHLVYKLYLSFLSLFLDLCNKFSFDLVFGKPHIIVTLLLYLSLILFLFFYQNRLHKRAYMMIVTFIFICIIQYNIPNIDSREIVYFIDVGQGDCSVLKIKNSKKVVLIDTGGSKYRDIANDVIIPFLKSKGINQIDKIIISHDDFDHNGSKDDIINSFKVNEVIDDSSADKVYIGDKVFKNLNISDNRDNDGSIVLYGEYGGLNYFFSGDISSKVEKMIIDNNELNVDILKVSHHGSESSTSDEFLSNIGASVALIGAGKNNLYNHPSSEVMDRLEKHKVKSYVTFNDGSMTIYKSLISGKIIIEKE